MTIPGGGGRLPAAAGSGLLVRSVRGPAETGYVVLAVIGVVLAARPIMERRAGGAGGVAPARRRATFFAFQALVRLPRRGHRGGATTHRQRQPQSEADQEFASHDV
jgi:hypothetical protein